MPGNAPRHGIAPHPADTLSDAGHSKSPGRQSFSRLDRAGYFAKFTNVIPAKAGIQFLPSTALAAKNWIPAFAGMTSCLWRPILVHQTFFGRPVILPKRERR